MKKEKKKLKKTLSFSTFFSLTNFSFDRRLLLQALPLNDQQPSFLLPLNDKHVKNLQKKPTPKLNPLKFLRVRLASPESIEQWAKRYLPNGESVGEVTNAKTVDFLTLVPEKGGLFCEQIFGPVENFQCSCKQAKTKTDGSVCLNCGVQLISSQSRRYKMGFIKLVSPATHIWYFKSAPSSIISSLLDYPKKELEAIMYCSESFSFNSQSFQKKLGLSNVRRLLKDYAFFSNHQSKSTFNDIEKPTLVWHFEWKRFLFDPNAFHQSEEGFGLQFKDFPFFLVSKNLSLINYYKHSKLFKVNPFFKKNNQAAFKSALTLVPNFSVDSEERYNFFIYSPFLKSFYTNHYPFTKNVVAFNKLETSKYAWAISKVNLEESRFLKNPSLIFKNESFQFLQKLNVLFLKNFSPNYISVKTVFFSLSKYQKFLKHTCRKSDRLRHRNFESSRFVFSDFLSDQFSLPLISHFQNFTNFSFLHLTVKKQFLNYSDLKNQTEPVGFLNPRGKKFDFQKKATKRRFSPFSPSFLSQSKRFKNQSWLPFKKKTKRPLGCSSYGKYFAWKLKPCLQLSWMVFQLKKVKKKVVCIQNLKLLTFENVYEKKLQQLNLKQPSLWNQRPLLFAFKSKLKLEASSVFLNSTYEPTLCNITHIQKFSQSLKKDLVVSTAALINNLYTVTQDFQWAESNDWNTFSNYWSPKANRKDTLIPAYLERGMTFDVDITGGSALKVLLGSFTKVHKNKPPFTLLFQSLNFILDNYNVEIQTLEQNLEKVSQTPALFFDNPKLDLARNIDLKFKKLSLLLSLRSKLLRRLKLIRGFMKSQVLPEWMLLSVLPVLPPTLRPILTLDNDNVAISDLNKFYQTIIFRNTRMKRFYGKYETLEKSPQKYYAHRLLQEAVDALIDNGKGDTLVTASNTRPLKSLSDLLKGKKGRFRQNLLGKRVDYSGRSVIVVGPKLKLHECGLPKSMALELFQPFLIRRMILLKLALNFIGAKKLLKLSPNSFLPLLRDVMEDHPILLNRAPTLHRLGVQAFQAKLIAGRTILLHPLVCSAFNADFDGDQMAVHIPLSKKACGEAWKLMGSRNHLLSPATGEPMIVPSQDMVLGCYYLTTLDKVYLRSQFQQLPWLTPLKTKKTLLQSDTKTPFSEIDGNDIAFLINQKSFQNFVTLTRKKGPVFEAFGDSSQSYYSDKEQLLMAFYQQCQPLHSSVWLRWNSYFEFAFQRESPLELRLDKFGKAIIMTPTTIKYITPQLEKVVSYLKTTAGRVLMNVIIQKAHNPKRG